MDKAPDPQERIKPTATGEQGDQQRGGCEQRGGQQGGGQQRSGREKRGGQVRERRSHGNHFIDPSDFALDRGAASMAV